MKRKSKSYVHPYPHLRYSMKALYDLYDSELHYYLVVDDSGYPPCFKYIIWTLKHMDLLPYMESGKRYDAFNEYMSRPRNLRKTLTPMQKQYISDIISLWKLKKENHDLQEQLKKIKKNE